MGDYYVYLHKKADTGEVFYVGKGRGRRAWKKERSEYWKNVVAKHGFTVQMWREGLTEEEAFAEEIRKITSLKAQDVKLANLTDGGEGCSKSEQTEEKQRQIREFFRREGRFPSRHRSEEKQMDTWLMHYCSPSCGSYDSAFDTEMRVLGYGSHKGIGQENKANKQAQIRAFFASNGRFPSRRRAEEKRMWNWLRNYCSPAECAYDEVFHAEMRALGYGSNRGKRPKEGK